MSDAENTQSTGILGEIKEGIHELEQKVENFIHPGAEGGAAAAGETAAVQTTGSGAPSVEPSSTLVNANDAGNSQAPTSGSPGSGDEQQHTTILRKIVGILRRDYNILGGELESWVKTAEQNL
jgi:hypothetical protein